jgi:hypothetical protein
MSERLCINCHWYNARQSCQAPQNMVQMRHVKLIDGLDRPRFTYRWFSYEYLRKNGWLAARLLQQCGKEGRWWKQRDTHGY